MRPITRSTFVVFWGDGLTCRKPTHRSVADVSPRWGGQASIGALELKPSGARQQPARVGQTLHSTTKTITEKEETP